MSVYMTEAEQLESIKKWWLRHQTMITITLSVVLFIVAGYRYWNWHVEKTIQQASTSYENMMNAVSSHDDKSAQSFANQLIHSHSQTFYAEAAHLTLAKVFVNQNNYAKAQEELSGVAHHAKNNPLRSIATIRLARLLMNDRHYAKALTELATLDNSAYVAVINELKGDIYTAMGEYPKAAASYKTAVKEEQSKGVINRFLEMKHDAVAAMAEPQIAAGTASQFV